MKTINHTKQVMSFRADSQLIDILHGVTHGTKTSASDFIREAIHDKLIMLQFHAETGDVKLSKEQKEELDEYIGFAKHLQDIEEFG